jgi:hypothetical protein
MLSTHRWQKYSRPISILLALLFGCSTIAAQAASDQPEVNDVHFHLTNDIQQGLMSIRSSMEGVAPGSQGSYARAQLRAAL